MLDNLAVLATALESDQMQMEEETAGDAARLFVEAF